jgi:hypothetical protein
VVRISEASCITHQMSTWRTSSQAHACFVLKRLPYEIGAAIQGHPEMARHERAFDSPEAS